MLDLHFKSTCTDASRDNSPFELSQDINFTELLSPQPMCELHEEAIKLQKVCKSYQTRRNQLADCAAVVEELWLVCSFNFGL